MFFTKFAKLWIISAIFCTVYFLAFTLNASAEDLSTGKCEMTIIEGIHEGYSAEATGPCKGMVSGYVFDSKFYIQIASNASLVEFDGQQFEIIDSDYQPCILTVHTKNLRSYTGWVDIYEQRYYYINGTLQVDWLKIDGKWYRFTEQGIQMTGFTSDGDYYYYLDSNGAMQIGWVKIDKKWYFFNQSGVMQIGWIKVNGIWYYLDYRGIMQTGWILYKEPNDWRPYWYYLEPSGAMRTGWLLYNNNWYYLKANGRMCWGEWLYVGNKWYLFDVEGAMKYGWQQADRISYYFNYPSGEMATGWKYLNRLHYANNGYYWYYFDHSGAPVKGWQKIDSKWYYFNENGMMAANETIHGYYVNGNGVWVEK
ncbi:hypothetical protein ACIQXV_26695 [Neobacillus sp. NPDC097160]|uniref:hypothetical protein n=1 Tax=Neobacillus sp. NPDC097160 TaxID=3364298 RepID=UPI003812BBC6